MSAVNLPSELRLISDLSTTAPVRNLAIEESILVTCATEKFQPTLRLWVNSPSVVLGINQGVFKYVNIDFCEKEGIQINRRLTGGGTVYMDEGNLNWSFFVPKSRALFPSPLGLFGQFGGILTDALRRLGYNVEFSPPNRIDSRGSKISGMAAYIRRDRILVHGTLLSSSNLVSLNGAMRLHTSPVAVSNLDGQKSAVEVADELLHALMENGLKLKIGGLTPEETQNADSLSDGKYRLITWIMNGLVTL